MFKPLFLFFIIFLLTHAPLSAQDTSKRRSSLLGTKFAEIRPETLAGTQLTLPDDARGNFTLITIAFKHGKHQQIDLYLNPCKRKYNLAFHFIAQEN